jgi:hypothetical protein
MVIKMDKIEDILVRNGENRILLPMMVERSFLLSNNQNPDMRDILVSERRKGQSPNIIPFKCSDSWSGSFESTYGLKQKSNRAFAGGGDLGNQVIDYYFDTEKKEVRLLPKATLVYFLENFVNKFGDRKDVVAQIYITGHTDCSAIKLVQTDYSNRPLQIRVKLDTLKIALGNYLEKVKESSIEPRIKNTILAETNLDFQVMQAVNAAREYMSENRFLVAGFCKDVDLTIGPRFGDCYLINLNGEKNPSKIKASDYLHAVRAALLDEKVKRLSELYFQPSIILPNEIAESSHFSAIAQR